MTKRAEVEPIRQPTLLQMEAAELARSGRPFCLPGIFLGTSSFTATGWEGSLYPIGMRSKDFLRHYASQFQTVEILWRFPESLKTVGRPTPRSVGLIRLASGTFAIRLG